VSFLLDECITEPVARALAILGCDVIYAPDVDVLGKGAKDDAVYNYAASKGHIVVTQDREMGENRTKQISVAGSNCGVFILRRPKQDSMRLKLVRILTAWDSICEKAAEFDPPYIFECRATGSKITRLR